jgi:hypothetical protein
VLRGLYYVVLYLEEKNGQLDIHTDTITHDLYVPQTPRNNVARDADIGANGATMSRIRNHVNFNAGVKRAQKLGTWARLEQRVVGRKNHGGVLQPGVGLDNALGDIQQLRQVLHKRVLEQREKRVISVNLSGGCAGPKQEARWLNQDHV